MGEIGAFSLLIISRTNRSASSPRKVGVALIGFAIGVKNGGIYIKLMERILKMES